MGRFNGKDSRAVLTESVTRRSLLSGSARALAGLLTGSVLFLSACGEDEEYKQNRSSSYGGNKTGATTKSKGKEGAASSKEPDEVTSGTDPDNDKPDDQGNEPDPEVIPEKKDGKDHEDTVQDPPEPMPAKAVIGARASGFFARGAPELTAEQIKSQQEINASCEGGSHVLVITVDELARLAKGERVQIESDRNPHPGNPTNHAHVITYEPIFG